MVAPPLLSKGTQVTMAVESDYAIMDTTQPAEKYVRTAELGDTFTVTSRNRDTRVGEWKYDLAAPHDPNHIIRDVAEEDLDTAKLGATP